MTIVYKDYTGDPSWQRRENNPQFGVPEALGNIRGKTTGKK